MPEHDEVKTPVGESTDQATELAPLDIIRTETVFSKLPVHNLAKKGRINISIVKQNQKGETTLKWEVSYSDRYGQARQLAYRLDTLFVNQKLNELERPLPKRIRLGTLREIANELDLGGDTNKVRKALRQNAFIGITAKLNYKALDGSEKYLEANFTRYSVIFTGEKLPDGGKADAVYIVLNDPYWEVWNNAPRRPLSKSYMEKLAPAAMRFYEIISRIFYTTIKYSHKHAKLLYSDYCTHSGQQRYYDWEHVRKQMYKIHKPHLDSGYIKAVSFEKTTGSEGKLDWIMYYVPGPKARAEHKVFTNPKAIEAQATEIAEEPAPTSSQAGEREVIQSNPILESEPAEKPSDIDLALLAELIKRGIHEGPGRQLLRFKAAGQYVMDNLEWGDHLINSAPPGKYYNPAGFYYRLVKDNIIPDEKVFETSRSRRLKEEARQQHDRKEQEKARLWLAYEEYKTQTLEDHIKAHYTDEQYQALIEAAKQEIPEKHPEYKFKSWTKTMQDKFIPSYVRNEISKQITYLTHEQFCEQEKKQRQAVSQSPTAQTEEQGTGERPAGSFSDLTTPTSSQPASDPPAQTEIATELL